jgi:two-component system, NtrC family, sensor kinase
METNACLKLKENVKMNNIDIYQALEEAFTATFIKELIPGILHNFANPLNGIMGRAKLLQRRIEESVKKMEEIYPDAAAGMMDELQRIRTDIRSISNESESFFDMFKDVAAKFYALAEKEENNINLSQLMNSEMRFVNFNLDFKHDIKKSIRLDNDVPDFRGNIAELSLAFWALIRFAMSRARGSQMKEFSIATEHDNKYVSVFIRNSGEALPVASIDALMECINSGFHEITDSTIDRGVFNAFLILNKYNARINMFSEESFSTISIGLPYRNEKPKRKEI